MNRRQYFNPNPKFARVGKLFQSIPVEARVKSLEGLNDAYKTNLEEYNKLNAAASAIGTMEGDTETKKKMLKKIQDKMKHFAENGGFEQADAFVGSLKAEFLGDKGWQKLAENYKIHQEDEAFGRELRAKGMMPIDGRKLKNGENFQSITYDENGNPVYHDYQGGYMARPDYEIPKTRLFDDVPQTSTVRWENGPNGSKKKVRVYGIDGKTIEDLADDAMTRYRTTNEYQTEMFDLKTQGYSDEQAEELIRESVLRTGMERVGMSQDEDLIGYKNSYDLQAQQAALNGPPKIPPKTKPKNQFIASHNKYSVSDPIPFLSGSVAGFAVEKGLSMLGVGNKPEEKAGVVELGEFTTKVDPTPTVRTIDQYYTLDTENSDPGFFMDEAGALKRKPITKELVQVKSTRIPIDPKTGKWTYFGPGSGSDLGRKFEEFPEIRQENGSYLATDKEGNTHDFDAINVEKYMDPETGEIYYVPMSAQTELLNASNEGEVINNRFIKWEAPRPNNQPTAIKEVDMHNLNKTMNQAYKDPYEAKRMDNRAIQEFSNYYQQKQQEFFRSVPKHEILRWDADTADEKFDEYLASPSVTGIEESEKEFLVQGRNNLLKYKGNGFGAFLLNSFDASIEEVKGKDGKTAVQLNDKKGIAIGKMVDKIVLDYSIESLQE